MIQRTLTNEELAYIAGIIDADGSIGLYKQLKRTSKNPYHYGRVTMANTCLDLVLWFKSILGGSFSIRKATDKHKEMYWWHIDNSTCVELCVLIRPYLKVKQRQCDNIIELYNKPSRKGCKEVPKEELDRREQLFLNNKELNRRGGW